MANRILETAPRNEDQIIRGASRSGVFLESAPSSQAALIKRMELMEANGQLRTVQGTRRSMDEFRRAQMDHDRQLSETMQRRIAPLQTFNHQMKDRRRASQQILGN